MYHKSHRSFHGSCFLWFQPSFRSLQIHPCIVQWPWLIGPAFLLCKADIIVREKGCFLADPTGLQHKFPNDILQWCHLSFRHSLPASSVWFPSFVAEPKVTDVNGFDIPRPMFINDLASKHQGPWILGLGLKCGFCNVMVVRLNAA